MVLQFHSGRLFDVFPLDGISPSANGFSRWKGVFGFSRKAMAFELHNGEGSSQFKRLGLPRLGFGQLA